jgi:hypothetical protein
VPRGLNAKVISIWYDVRAQSIDNARPCGDAARRTSFCLMMMWIEDTILDLRLSVRGCMVFSVCALVSTILHTVFSTMSRRLFQYYRYAVVFRIPTAVLPCVLRGIHA